VKSVKKSTAKKSASSASTLKGGFAFDSVVIEEVATVVVETPSTIKTASVVGSIKSKKGKSVVFEISESNDTVTESVLETSSRKRAPSRAKNDTKGKKAKVIEPIIEIEDEEEIVLLCDGCDAECLLEDAGLDAVPEGDWFCSACTKAKDSKSSKAATSNKRASDKISKNSSTAEKVVEKPVAKKGKKTVEVAESIAPTRRSTRNNK
jgi:hypothetical protein